MERIFALYDSDIFYTTRFMEYYKKKQDFGFEMAAFTCRDSLGEFLQNRSIEILLLGEAVTLDGVNLDRVGHIYQLTDKPGSVPGSGYPGIMKYQPAQSVVNDILSEYRRQVNKSVTAPNSGQMRLVSVFSPVPNAEALTFTWSGALIQANYKKVLLVLLELLPVQLISSTNYSSQSLTEFIYYLKETPDIITKMNALLGYQGNLAYLAGAADGTDILAVNKEDIRKWVDGLRSETDYQEIIFYIGFYSEAAVELMDLSDTVIMAVKGTPYENAAFAEFTRQLEQSGMKVSHDKFIRLELPEENIIKQLPLSPSELKDTASWSFAGQNPNLF